MPIISAIIDTDEIELEFDPARSESPVFYRYPELCEEWRPCPFQSVDLRHLTDDEACAKINDWVG